MKVLCIGDIVGPNSIEYLSRNLGRVRASYNIDVIVANAENASSGNGLSKSDAESIFQSGVDIITLGNHVWKKKDLHNFLDENDSIIRPANYPTSCPGRGYLIYDYAGIRILCINVLGLVYGEALRDPFDTIDEILNENTGKYDFAVLDVHAEATAEKYALARYFDGKIAVIFGTHTHVQTSDAKILPKGSAYITDLGMTGPVDSILGIKYDIIINKFRTHMPIKFDVADGEIQCNAAIFTLNKNYKAESVEAIKF